MSVKLMTTDQLHNDLEHTHKMWAGGIPTEQVDRINALKAELKRRGADAREVRPEEPRPRSLDTMSNDQLSVELRTLSERIGKNPHDDEAQGRFADVRFELRKRDREVGELLIARERTQSALLKTGAFDPVTGQTDKAKAVAVATNGNGLGNGNGNGSFEPEVSRHTTETPTSQAARTRNLEQVMTKYHLAKVAADVASGILMKHADPNGDDIENACTIGVQVAENIYSKVGL